MLLNFLQIFHAFIFAFVRVIYSVQNINSTHYEAPKLCNINQESAFSCRRALLTPLTVKYLLREEHEIAKHGLR
jgi:hypothetical protein